MPATSAQALCSVDYSYRVVLGSSVISTLPWVHTGPRPTDSWKTLNTNPTSQILPALKGAMEYDDEEPTAEQGRNSERRAKALRLGKIGYQAAL